MKESIIFLSVLHLLHILIHKPMNYDIIVVSERHIYRLVYDKHNHRYRLKSLKRKGISFLLYRFYYSYQNTKKTFIQRLSLTYGWGTWIRTKEMLNDVNGTFYLSLLICILNPQKKISIFMFCD